MADTQTQAVDSVLLSTKDHVATVTLNRPDVQNTISPDMLDGLCAKLLQANDDPDVRAIILSG